MPVAGLPEHPARTNQLVIRGMLVAQLEHVHAAAERRLEQLVEVRPNVRDEVEPGLMQPLETGAQARYLA